MHERILAIDYGRKRIGLAASDPLGLIAQPIGTLEGSPDDAADLIAKECVERDIARIVLGLPLNMDGTEGFMAKEVREFGALLSQKTGLPVIFQDERLSSYSAEQDLKEQGVKRRKGKKGKSDRARVDAMAAALILREYMGQSQ